MTTSGDENSALNSARIASVAWYSGLSDAIVRSHSGANDIGSITPDRSRSGSAIAWVSGASASSLPMTRAIAYEIGPSIRPMSASSPNATTNAQRVDRQAERDRQHDEDQALEQEHDDVAEAAAEDRRGAAHRRHPHPLDDAVAHLVDEPEADERRAEQGGHDEQARDEHVERAAGREAGHAREAVEQRAEQEEVDERLDDAGDQPGGLADGQAERSAEHEPGVGEEAHRERSFRGRVGR